MIDHDRLTRGTPVVIEETGEAGTIQAVENGPYFPQFKVAGGWYRPSQLCRTDDPDRVIPGRSRV